MLVAAALGGMLTWLAGPSKGLLLISHQEGYLPPFLQKLNGHGVQQNMQAKIALSNGAGGPGQRPVISDNVAINAAEPAVSVYCPDQLGAFKKAYGDLKYADTVDE